MVIVNKLERIEPDKDPSTTKSKRSVYFITEMGLQIKTSTEVNGKHFSQNIFLTGNALEQIKAAWAEICKIRNINMESQHTTQLLKSFSNPFRNNI